MIKILTKLFRTDKQGNFPITPLDFELRFKQQKSHAYSIELFNDDITDMEFVVNVLRVCFGLTEEKAIETTVKTHKEGYAKILQLEKESAEMLINHVKSESQKWNFPFRLNVVNA